MASKRFDPLKTQGLQRVRIGGSFRPAGTGAPTNVIGQGFSVARTSVGLFTITFDDSFAALDEAEASVRVADATPTICQFGDWDSSAKTMQLRTLQEVSSASVSPGFKELPLATTRELGSNEYPAIAANGGLLANDSTPLIEAVNPGTDQATRINWAAGNTDKIAWPFVLPSDCDTSADVTLHLLAQSSSTNDTPVLTAEVFMGVGDSDAGGATAALSDTLAEVTVTIAAANVPALPTFGTITITPGAHATDAVWCYGAWLEYTKADTTSLQLTDLAADADNVVNFDCVFRNTSVDY